MNYNDAKDVLKNYLQARIPIIMFDTVEKERVERMIFDLAGEGFTNIYIHSMSTGMVDLNGVVISNDKSFLNILNFIADDLRTKSGVTYVLTDVQDLDVESSSSRLLSDLAKLAEKKNSSIIIVSENGIWANLKRLGMIIKLDYPEESEIYNLLHKELDKYKGQIVNEWDDDNFKEASTILLGLSEAEIKNVIYVMIARREVTKDDLVDMKFAKSHLFSNMDGLEQVDTDDVTYVGLENLKKWLQSKKKLFDVNKKADLIERGIKPPRGVLVVGVPGCGKSLTAKAISKEWDMPLYLLDFAMVQGMYVGQSEEQLKRALKTAEQVSPCILWIDEIEKGLSGAKDASGVTTKMIGQFLYWLQECDKEVFVVATANEVESLPAELLRKGRFDEIFFVDLPTDKERSELITSYFAKYLQLKVDGELLNSLVSLTNGFASSDIEATIRDISYEVIAEDAQIDATYVQNIFKMAVPISKTNPEKVEFIRNWGKARAKKAS